MLMKNIYIQLLSWWNFMLLCYDESVVGKAIARVCNFFGNSCKESPLLNRFKTGLLPMKYVKTSFFARLVSLPFALVKSIYTKNAAAIERLKSQSVIVGLVTNLHHIPFSGYGAFVLFFGLGAIAGAAVKGGIDLFAIATSTLLVLVGLALLPVKDSVKNVVSTSSLARLLCRVTNTDPLRSDSEKYIPGGKWLFFAFAFVMGVCGGYVNLPIILLGLGGLLFVALVLWKPVLGVYCIVLGTALLPTMVMVGLVALTAVSFVIHLAGSKSTGYNVSSFTLPIVVFIGLAAISTLTGVKPAAGLPVLLVYLVFTMGYTLIVNIIKTPRQWHLLIKIFVLSAFFVAAYGVIQNFFLDEMGSGWVDTEMFEDIKTRVFSTLDNPNILGQFLIFTIPVVLACVISAASKPEKLVYSIAFVTCIACLFLTWSRAAWVGVAIAVVVMLINKDKRFIFLCVAGLILAPFVLPQSILDRITSIGNLGDGSTSYRIAVWVSSIYMLRDFLFTGIGLGTAAFGAVYEGYAYGGANFALHAHNFYLQWIVDMGIGGLLVFFVIIITALRAVTQMSEKTKLAKHLRFAAPGIILGFLFQGMAETMWYNYRMILVFWIFMAIIQSSSLVCKKEDADA